MDAPSTENGTEHATPAAGPEHGEDVILCCSGGGIRSAAFCLGALQKLQDDDLFQRVTTITAVSGGSYTAAAWSLQQHLLATPDRAADDAPPGRTAGKRRRRVPEGLPRVSDIPPLKDLLSGTSSGEDPKAFALGTPEERHLRANTRYIAPDAPTALFGLSVLFLGILVNLIIVGVPLLFGSALLGWALRGADLLRLGTKPTANLPWWLWLSCFAPLIVGTLASWVMYLFSQTRDRDVLVGRRFRDSVQHDPAVPRSWPVQAWRKWWEQDAAGRAASIAWLLARMSLAAVACLLVAPAVIAYLSRIASPSGAGSTLATAAQGFGFGHHGGAPAVTFPAFVAALAALARTSIGKIRTYRKDLDGALSDSTLATVGRFARDRLAPYLGVLLVTVAAAVVSWSLTALAVRTAPYGSTSGYWARDLVVAAVAIGLWLVIRALVDINHTSLHRYYRDRLAAAYAGGMRDNPHPSAATLSSLRPGAAGRRRQPDLVLCASAADTGPGDLPPGRNAVSYTFTPTDVGVSAQSICGGESYGSRRAPTTSFEAATVDFTLFDAVAVAGAALAPLMGNMTTPSKRILFALANVRLGMWLPSAAYVQKLTVEATRFRRVRRAWKRLLSQHHLRRLWAEMAGTLHLDGKWLYVTDGGHYENLGLVEALRRKPKMVIVLDASGDHQGSFTTLGQAIALARTECQVDIDLDPLPIKLEPAAQGSPLAREVARSVVTGTYKYRCNDERPGTLIFARLGVTPEHPWDVRSYLAVNAGFPTTTTLSQLYDGAEFEAYRAMGESTGAAIVAYANDLAGAVASTSGSSEAAVGAGSPDGSNQR